MTLKNAVGDRITTYCILDSDYHSEAEIRERYLDAQTRGVNLHVWSRKEIENYLLQPRAIRRVLSSRVKNKEVPSQAEVYDKILEICDQERRSVEDGIASALMQANRKLDVISANKAARARVGEMWGAESNRPILVSGKDLLARLSDWTQKEFGSAFGAPAIARHMATTDLATELVTVIRAIEEGSGFPSFEERQKLLSSDSAKSKESLAKSV
jgi:hypothetical protein